MVRPEKSHVGFLLLRFSTRSWTPHHCGGESILSTGVSQMLGSEPTQDSSPIKQHRVGEEG